MKFYALIILSIFFFPAESAYPSTYPFAIDSYVHTSIPASTPSLTYDAEDPGGYIYTYTYSLDDFEIPFCPMFSMFSSYVLVTVYKVAPSFPLSAWNCTAKEIVFEEADFTGEILGSVTEQVCEKGSCCAHLIGHPKYADETLVWEDWLNKGAKGGLCGEVEKEDLYCALVDAHFRTNCIDRYVSTSERLVVFPCQDLHMLFWLSCPVFKDSGNSNLFVPVEPVLYMSALTPLEDVAVLVLTHNVDRVCYPLSYYEAASEPVSGDSSTSTSQNSEVSSTAASVSTLISVIMLCAF